MTPRYDPVFVSLSVIVAMLASFAALDLAGRVRLKSGATRFGWLAGGGTVMGLGIWSMHFVCMLAFHLPVPIGYDVPLMLLSVVVAIAASLLALMVISRPKLGLLTLVPGGMLMGGAIAGMHYIGMASIQADAHLTYTASIVAWSVAIAIVASITALWLAFTFRFDVTVKGLALKILSATVMGIAISGMHYTGMAAAHFAPAQPSPHSAHLILASGELGGAIFVSAILIIILALIGAFIDRSMQASSAAANRLSEQTIQLRNSERQYRLLFDHNPNPMWVYERGTRAFLAVNDAAIAHYGYSREEFLKLTLKIIRIWADTPSSGTIIFSPETGTQGPAWNGRHRKKDGTLIDVAVTSQDIVFDGRDSHLALAIDVTDWRRADEALRESEHRTRLIIDTALDAVITMDAAGRITDWNTQAEIIFGWSREGVLGQRMAETIIPLKHRKAHEKGLQRFLETGVKTVSNQRIEITALRRDGTEFPVELAISPARLGTDWTFSAFVRDLTEQKKAAEALLVVEAQLRQASKMEAVGQLAGGVAHDFNNLLTAIMSYSAMLLDRIELDDPNRDDVREIIGAADRAAGLTRQLLAFSRKQVMQPRVININVVINDLENMLRRLIGEDIELHTSLDPRVARINADPGQLEQVLMNLIVNARDAMPKGGRLSIGTSNAALSAGSKGALHAASGDYVMLAVSDTGTGMTPDVQQRLFDPFFTTKEQGRGTGLGLSTVYGIVQQSGGEICVSSEPGVGTTFNVYFPRLIPTEDEHREDTNRREIPKGRETVLLVEDDASLRTLAVRVLKNYGYEVLVASSGREALAIALQLQTHIDVVISDVVMPGMNGRQLVEKLFEIRPQMPALLMSGYADDDILRRGVMRGDTAFLQKPFTPEQLARKLRGVLDTRPVLAVM
jgi:two-component system, cell cycle sensor histidine kinase and response regulator CckA